MSDLPIDAMLADVALVEKTLADGYSVLQKPVVDVIRDLCCHVKALASECERLSSELKSLRGEGNFPP